MAIIYRNSNYIEAQLVKGMLEAEGFDVRLHGSFLTGALGELPAENFIAIEVPDHQAESALLKVREYEEAIRQDQDAPDAGSADVGKTLDPAG